MSMDMDTIKAARALLGWKTSDLAAASGISEMNIRNIERGTAHPQPSTLAAIEKAFADAGVVVTEPEDTQSGVAGVRLIGD